MHLLTSSIIILIVSVATSGQESFPHFLTFLHDFDNVAEVSPRESDFSTRPCVERIVLAMWTEKELSDLDRDPVCQPVSNP